MFYFVLFCFALEQPGMCILPAFRVCLAALLPLTQTWQFSAHTRNLISIIMCPELLK